MMVISASIYQAHKFPSMWGVVGLTWGVIVGPTISFNTMLHYNNKGMQVSFNEVQQYTNHAMLKEHVKRVSLLPPVITQCCVATTCQVFGSFPPIATQHYIVTIVSW